ncbi:hypothetical protein ACAW63_24215 [Pseudomonas sp. QE6]|uniref:hypothetical protein n=1 Tax=Pseudomonas sp. QE6 TaxID=3242491 RepID=UPI0035284F32
MAAAPWSRYRHLRGAPQLVAQKSLIEAWRPMYEVSSELHWTILQLAETNGFQIPMEIENLHLPIDIQRANQNHKHASETSINSCFTSLPME